MGTVRVNFILACMMEDRSSWALALVLLALVMDCSLFGVEDSATNFQVSHFVNN